MKRKKRSVQKETPSTLHELEPKAKHRVMDLVRAAGIDVRDWGNYKRGPKYASTNPKYCYEWAFVEPGRIVVVNLWYGRLQVRRRVIFTEFNSRESIRKHSSVPGHGVWRARAEKLHSAIREAIEHNLPIRAIINEGTMRSSGGTTAKASHVDYRLLDPFPWMVQSYDVKTGKYTLARGALPGKTVDQFMLYSEAETSPDRRDVTGSTYVRNPLHRARALERAHGRCVYCGGGGITMADGRVFLETHHIIPLGIGGPDAEHNVVALCPNHHREAHFGARAQEILEVLLMRNRLSTKTNT